MVARTHERLREASVRVRVTGADPVGPASAPTAGLRVRELRWSDFDDLRESYYLLYEERQAGYPIGITLFAERPSYADEAAWFSTTYQKVLAGDMIASVAELDGHAVGNCMVGRVGPSASSESGHMGLLGIVVHRDYRGRGIGSALLRDALRQCRGKFEAVRLSVFSVNKGARRLYERFGFVLVGHLPRVVRRGTEYFDEDLMLLDLTRPEANR